MWFYRLLGWFFQDTAHQVLLAFILVAILYVVVESFLNLCMPGRKEENAALRAERRERRRRLKEQRKK